jgi:hypothetical protein
MAVKVALDDAGELIGPTSATPSDEAVKALRKEVPFWRRPLRYFSPGTVLFFG